MERRKHIWKILDTLGCEYRKNQAGLFVWAKIPQEFENGEEGVFGDITHTEGAYLHDLRALLLHDTYYQGQWRLKQHASRNGNFYTTHGLLPSGYLHMSSESK